MTEPRPTDRKKASKVIAIHMAAIIVSAAGAEFCAAADTPFVAFRYTVLPEASFETGVSGTTTGTLENQLAAGGLRFVIGEIDFDAGLDYQYTRYEYEGLDSRNRDLHRIQFPVSFVWRDSDREVQGFVAPGISTSSNVLRNPLDRLTSDDFHVAGRIEVAKQRGQAGSWMAGLAYDRAFGKPRLYPRFGLAWTTPNGLEVDLVFPEPAVRYQVSERQRLTATLFPAGHQWHVVTDDLGDEFAYRFEALRSELAWSYRFWRNFSVDLSLGYEFSRRHRLEDAAGDVIAADAVDELMVSIGIRSGSAPLVLTHGAHL